MKKSGWSNKTKALRKVGKVMHEFKEGTLHSGKSEKVVKNPKQAIAIALSEAGLSKKETGGGVDEQGIDLFEDYENIPENVQNILDKYEDDFVDGNYSGLEKASNELEKIGYTFEYYLDGQAYDLRPIGTKGKSEVEEYVNGGGVGNDWFNKGVGTNGLNKIKEYSKQNPKLLFLVTDDNWSNIGNYILLNGKFAKKTVANASYDLQNSKVSLKPKSDVVYKMKQLGDPNGYYAKGGGVDDNEVKFIEYKDKEIMYEPTYNKYYANDEEFDSLEDAKNHIDGGSPLSQKTINAYRHGSFKNGGEVGESNNNFQEIDGNKFFIYNFENKGNKWSVMISWGKYNHVNVTKKTNNPFGNKLGNEFDTIGEAVDNYKDVNIKSNILFAANAAKEYGYEAKYANGGGVDMNDWDMPVIRSQFEEEEYEYGNGGGIYSRTMKTPDGNITGKVQYNDFWKTYQVVIDGTVYEEFKTQEEAIQNLKNAGFDKMALGGGVEDQSFDYMMLGRLRSDNDYYLGYGNRSEKHLWAGNVHDQIDEMKRIWNRLKVKPEWLSLEDILEYERKMKNNYANGGGIPNNYLGKGVDEVWNDWTETQRMHFLLDHQVHELHPSKVMISFNELPPKVRVELIQHISEGQYGEGGGVDINDWDMPVIRTQFEDEEYEYAKGGSIGDSGTITDKKSMFVGKMGTITGDLGNMYEVMVLDNGNVRTVLVKKNGISIVSDEYANGGGVKYYNKENEYRLGRPSGSIEKEILNKVTFKNAISEQYFAGSFGWKTTQGKLGDGYLYNLDEFDQDLIKDLKLKSGEKVFRYVNRTTAIGGMTPFIKINLEKSLLYFPIHSDNDDVIFETKGVNPLFINIIEDKMANGGNTGEPHRAEMSGMMARGGAVGHQIAEIKAKIEKAKKNTIMPANLKKQYIEKYQKQLAALEPKKVVAKKAAPKKAAPKKAAVKKTVAKKEHKFTIDELNAMNSSELATAYKEKFDINASHQSYVPLATALFFNKRIKYITEKEIAEYHKKSNTNLGSKKSTKAVEPTGDRTERAITQDKQRLAKKAGKRISENGNIYYENRENRSDKNRKTRLEDGGMAKGWKHRGK